MKDIPATRANGKVVKCGDLAYHIGKGVVDTSYLLEKLLIYRADIFLKKKTRQFFGLAEQSGNSSLCSKGK